MWFKKLFKPKGKIPTSTVSLCTTTTQTVPSTLKDRLWYLIRSMDTDAVLADPVFKRMMLNVYTEDISHLLTATMDLSKVPVFITAVSLNDYFKGTQLPVTICLSRLADCINEDTLKSAIVHDIDNLLTTFSEITDIQTRSER